MKTAYARRAVERRPWDIELAEAMRALRYDASCVNEEIYAYAEAHGTLTGCELVDPDDLAALNEIIVFNNRLFATPSRLPIDDAPLYGLTKPSAAALAVMCG